MAARRSRSSINNYSVKKQTNTPEEVLYKPSCWCPTARTSAQILFSSRFCAALSSNISDCDETFNYWEPMHFLMYGSGFQTWEYSPSYSIRSYAYVLLHSLPAQLQVYLFQANKVLVFYFLRLFLACLCAGCEIYFYKGVQKQFDNHVARLVLVFILFGSGMFISSTAFLPSSFAMYMCFLSYGAWFQRHYAVAIFTTAFGSLLGWPFSVILGLPIAFDLVIRQRMHMYFLQWSVISAVSILGPMIYTDSYYFGKFVIAPLSIILYNVFGKGGPNLYGTEPWTFYFINGFLNFNVVFPMSLFAIPIHFITHRFRKKSEEKKLLVMKKVPHYLVFVGFYLWLLIFFTRPHKEERFLFPVYPLIVLGGAFSCSRLQKLFHRLYSSDNQIHYSTPTNWLTAIMCLVFTALSLSRSFALFYGYHAPLDVYLELNHMVSDPEQGTVYYNRNINVCVGKEWYRYPSSFFLPNDRWHLRFIKSEFRAQLPKPYASGGDATRVIPSHMNDMNLEEPTRYTDISKCHFLVDLETPFATKYEPNYAKMEADWVVVVSKPFLDTSRSNKLLRAFYVPYLSDKYTRYINYNLLKSTRLQSLLMKQKKSRRRPVEEQEDAEEEDYDE